MTKAAVVGSGSWGTAFASVLADAGAQVTMWARRPAVVAAINDEHCNVDYLPDLRLPPSLRATDQIAEATDGADLIIVAVPSQSLRENLAGWGGVFGDRAPVVSLMKGVELGTTKRMSEVLSEAGDVDPGRVVVLSGPNLAKEIAARQPAAAVVASTSPRMRAVVAEACATPYFRPYLGGDVIGTEIAGATKNVIAVACGIASGMGMGDNTLASLITRGLAETARLGAALGADPATFLGLAGVGDLVATCASPLSRNRTFGFSLGQGHSVQETIAATKQVAEGVKSCRSILDLARAAGVDVPIVENIEAVVYEGRSTADVAGALMSRARKLETS